MNNAVHHPAPHQFRVAHLLGMMCLVAFVLKVASLRANMCYGALHVCLAAPLLYIAKWRIIRSGASWSVAILAYAFVVALLLPYVWLRVIYPLTYSAWFACPLLVYPLPTTTFLAIDLWSDGQTARIYWSRTCVELLILAMIAVGWWHYWAHHGGIIAPGLPW